jgi:hypothetical protein
LPRAAGKWPCEFQVEKAREIADRLGTSDIRVIGEALERETIPHLMELAGVLRGIEHLAPEKIGGTLSGEFQMHGCALVGSS